jgi:hypothetical protein
MMFGISWHINLLNCSVVSPARDQKGDLAEKHDIDANLDSFPRRKIQYSSFPTQLGGIESGAREQKSSELGGGLLHLSRGSKDAGRLEGASRRKKCSPRAAGSRPGVHSLDAERIH